MRCDCCGKRKGLLESFERIQTKYGELNLCVTCSNLLYKIRDTARDKDKDGYEACCNELEKRAKKETPLFAKWLNGYLNNNKID